MRSIRRRSIAGLALGAGAVLALPALASAHPSVFEVTAKTVVPNTNPVQLANQTQYVFTNHGYTAVFRESNGALDKGGINYKVLPSAYRNQAGFTKTQLLAEGDTGVQAHATCRGAAALTESVILAWQGTDPFYDYVPWQKTAAGFEDDPAKWIPVVQSATGVNLSSLSGDAAFAAACSGIGGTYTAPDAIVTTQASLASGTIADVRAPLDATISSQTSRIAELDAARVAAANAATAAQAAAKYAQDEVARLVKTRAPLGVSLPKGSITGAALASKGTKVTVRGPAGRRVVVSLRVPAARAKALGLAGPVLGSRVVGIGSGGTTAVTLKPTGAGARAIASAKGGLRVTATVTQVASATR